MVPRPFFIVWTTRVQDRRSFIRHTALALGAAALPFDFEVPCRFFEKSEGGEGKVRRIGGIISLETKDQEDELILQNGLDFDSFLRNGWFNDNHSKDTTGIVGYPEMVQRFKQGDMLPDGTVAETNLTWAEGYLLETDRANRIWELGKALQGTGRSLGFSVEGKVQQRLARNKKIIAKAKVRNVAITNCPVHDRSRLEILSKSLMAVEQCTDEALIRALGMGTIGGPLTQPAGPQSGATAGQVLARESLETGTKPRLVEDDDDDDDVVKSLTDAEAVAWVMENRPGMSLADAGRFVQITKALKRHGRL